MPFLKQLYIQFMRKTVLQGMSSPRKRSMKDPTNPHAELNDLVIKLQEFLPASSSTGDSREKIAAIIKETCKYIRRLQKEVKNIGERLSLLLDSMENNGLDVDILRNLLQQ
uniref:transcription factor ILI6-like n=1 Tax=Erigeron canadensis TaxID=72917 RepID=UPI001CB97885|nr:transcription factor ILI6-like [Erigeron canadensis]